MRIREMFEKKIDRDIKGVIKIGQDDDTNVDQELEEYVVTRERKIPFDNRVTLSGHIIPQHKCQKECQ